jgi:opacity protein-like surface antigen
MRLFMGCLAVIGFACTANAGGFGEAVLRGSTAYQPGAPTYFSWSGFYAGGQFGYSAARLDFANATASQIAFVLRESALENRSHVSSWQMLENQDTTATSYGGFIGYNYQLENVVLGMELNYNRSSVSGASSSTLSRGVTPGDGYLYHTTVSSAASMKITDFGTVRARAGYVYGRFMPYATIALAGGRADVARSSTVFGSYELADGTSPSTTPFSFPTQSEGKTAFIWGYGFSAGVEVALAPGTFVRGEYEYVQFLPFQGMSAGISTARAAAGIRF